MTANRCSGLCFFLGMIAAAIREEGIGTNQHDRRSKQVSPMELQPRCALVCVVIACNEVAIAGAVTSGRGIFFFAPLGGLRSLDPKSLSKKMFRRAGLSGLKVRHGGAVMLTKEEAEGSLLLDHLLESYHSRACLAWMAMSRE